jgi:CheY-like chemotaxis protein
MMSLKNISQRFVSSRSGSYRSTNNSKKDVTVEKIVLGNKETYMGIKAGYLVVNVEDYGAGMTPEQLAKVFGEGTQFNVNKLQAGNGSGLGLFIAKGIAELHGGSLTVSSPGLGMGTTFTLMVPLFEILESGKVQKDDVNTARTNEASGRSAKEGQPLLGLDRDKKLRVLVVDDASSNRKMLSRILQNRGHICEQAADGLEAVEKYFKSEVTSQPFDTILMDSEMPNMNGPDAAKKIRELGCQYLITGVSGNVLPEDVANYVAHGANGVLPKPLNIDDLENLWYNHKVMPPRMLTADQRKARNDYGYELNMRKNDPAAASLSSLLDAHSKTAESSPIKESPIKKKASSSFHEAAPITAHTTLDLDADPLAKNSKTRLPPIDPTTRKVLPSSEGTGLDVV